MYLPSQEEFTERSKKYNLIPVYKEYMVDIETPTSIFIKAGGLEKKMFLLESVEGEKTISRYSIIGIGYNATLEFTNKIFTVKDSQGKKSSILTRNPLAEVENILKDCHMYKDPGLDHFTGGAVGYLSYDLVHYFENIPLACSKTVFPEILLMLTDLVIIFDHLLNRMKIISTEKIGMNDDAKKIYLKSIKKIKILEKKIFKENKLNMVKDKFLPEADFDDDGNANFNSNLSKDEFIKAVVKAKKYINDGEIFQVVLSQKFFTNKFPRPFSIYRRLRSINPSPYMYYMNFGSFKIIGSSPEPLLKINGKKIQTYPIAGTRKRGRNFEEDKILMSELLNDKKEKAEHNMLVDLARNDLGKVCKYGSVKVKKYMYIEKYSNVIHLVSRVEGVLSKGKTIFDAIKSTFPAGTLSGSPKIRAMQIISELEPDRRNIYGGVVGYFGYDGSLNTCITIRTAVINGKTACVQAGAGIVSESKPENEWEETINKAKAIFRSINISK